MGTGPLPLSDGGAAETRTCGRPPPHLHTLRVWELPGSSLPAPRADPQGRRELLFLSAYCESRKGGRARGLDDPDSPALGTRACPSPPPGPAPHPRVPSVPGPHVLRCEATQDTDARGGEGTVAAFLFCARFSFNETKYQHAHQPPHTHSVLFELKRPFLSVSFPV